MNKIQIIIGAFVIILAPLIVSIIQSRVTDNVEIFPLMTYWLITVPIVSLLSIVLIKISKPIR